MRALLGASLLACLLAAAGCGDDACEDAECPSGQRCSRAGRCVPPGGCHDARDCARKLSCNDGNCSSDPGAGCSTDGDCASGELCATAGRCIGQGSCLAQEDCRADGVTCKPSGACLPEANCELSVDCEAGYRCAEGACVPGGGCGSAEYGLDAPPNVLILLDRSGSMDEELDGSTKWEIARTAITDSIGGWGSSIRFGLGLFSNCAVGECAPGTIVVPCGDDTVDDIISLLATAERCSTTPIASSLEALVGEPLLADRDRRNAILLVTDGMDSCDGDPSGPAGELASQDPPVPTFVVGFGGGVDPGELTEVAQAGGTDAGDPAYYQADGAGDLTTALNAIAGRVLGCTYPLTDEPDDPSLLYVFFNDETPVARDGANGWEYDASSSSVTFFGDACAQIESGAVQDIDIVYGCNEPIE